MNITAEYEWGGTAREPILVIRENGCRVAAFEDDKEACQWLIDEYGEDVAAHVM